MRAGLNQPHRMIARQTNGTREESALSVATCGKLSKTRRDAVHFGQWETVAAGSSRGPAALINLAPPEKAARGILL
jgi:hypothetical protein